MSIFPGMTEGIQSDDVHARIDTLTTIKTLAEFCLRWTEPYFIKLLPLVIDNFSSKDLGVQKAAEEAGISIIHHASSATVGLLIPPLLEGLDRFSWKCKTGVLMLIKVLATTHPIKIGFHLPAIIPKLVQQVHSTKQDVRDLARSALHRVCSVQDNPDIAPALQDILNAYVDPINCTTVAVDKLYSTSFIQPVDCTALALIIPVIMRGMKHRMNVYKRRCAVIMDSMCKLVTDPHDILLFFPQLEAILMQGQEEIDKEEIRHVCARTLETLRYVQKEALEGRTNHLSKATMLTALVSSTCQHCSLLEGDMDRYQDLLEFMAELAGVLLDIEDEDVEDWHHIFEPYLRAFVDRETARKISKDVTAFANSGCVLNQEVDEDMEEDLCNAEFSLAYGSRVLLHQTSLHLKRGRKYGLVGPNGAGKSTLMRSIANGNLQGFPTDVRTVYVEHDIQGNHSTTSVVDYIKNNEHIQSTGEDRIRQQLHQVGFTDDMQGMPVTSLSGGWRMKLALSRAILTNPDMLLLDEPTNHLDKPSCEWLLGYLKSLTHVTCLIVSHDTWFLDAICTDIIHYEKNRKLKRYRGNLSDFVRERPEARSYYELSTDIVKFHFPSPGPLIGVKSLTKAVLKLSNVSFQYPGSVMHQLSNVSVQVSLASRVAIIGANGAGKSTLIKLLVGDLELQTGELYRHPNVRIAYVAQHAFHHIEHHLDKSPCQYVMWRYSNGIDKEMSQRDSLQLTEEEWDRIVQQAKENRTPVAERIVGRIDGKRDLEYEVKWRDMEETQFVARSELSHMGYEKWILSFDERLSQSTNRKLTTSEIARHFEAFGLDENFSVHSHIGGLSGGQKVKVVLAAAMWNRPHIIIMDEPTNFLDRDSLGALTLAIKDFEGGVLLISHHTEFYSELCNEQWILERGQLHAQGGDTKQRVIKDKVQLEEQEQLDAFGNTVKPTEKKIMDRSERKRLEKKRKDMIKNGQDTYDIDELLGIH